MKRLLNTLYVTTQGAYLSKESETVVVRIEGERRLQLPLLSLGSIVSFGQVNCSPALMQACGEKDIAISFLSMHGRFLARVVGETHGNVLLRREQYRRADDGVATRNLAIAFIAGKIANARTSIQRGLRDRPDHDRADDLRDACRQLGALAGQLGASPTVAEARGLEGAAAREYFGVFDALITQQRESFRFHGRSRRPPLDNVNALLSFVYTLLLHDVRAAIEANGLDPAVGFLHRDRPGRPGLALDLLEEFRAPIADRLVLSLINLRQVCGDDFETQEGGGVLMTEAARKTVLTEYQKRKGEEVLHPFVEERVAIGLLPHISAQLLARHLRGDLDAYPPFVSR